jgi:riboflavin-specific deaminase-like protein
MNPIEAWLARAGEHRQRTGRPLVSLCYAQSLDGSLSERRGQATALSGPESRRLTHRLRSQHDTILVGIGTVLADDPSLTVRYVENPGTSTLSAFPRHPRPVIVDSRLSFPLTARMLRDNPNPPWLAVTELAPPERVEAAGRAGLELIRQRSDPEGHVPLGPLLEELAARAVSSVMVEGGARILSAFLRQGLADLLCVTVAPRYIGGLNVIDPPGVEDGFPAISDVHYERLGEDMILYGRLSRQA